MKTTKKLEGGKGTKSEGGLGGGGLTRVRTS